MLWGQFGRNNQVNRSLIAILGVEVIKLATLDDDLAGNRNTWALVAPAMVFDPLSGQQIFAEPGFEIEGFGSNGFLALVPSDSVTAWNLSLTILIVHGWLYVIYLFASYRLWNIMRWRFLDFLWLALGGIVPVLSFVLESIYTRRVRRFVTATAQRGGTA